MYRNLTTIFAGISLLLMGVGIQADEKLDFSGFARLVGGYLDTDQADFKGYKNQLGIEPSTLLGLQAEYQALDSVSIVGQVIARANDEDDSGLEWLYLNWKPVNSLQLKLGKLRTPFFTLSDFTDVGYAYHWITPPTQVYNAYLFRKYNGIDLTWTYSTERFDFNFEVYTGESQGEVNVAAHEVGYEIENLRGLIGHLRVGNFQLRASHYKGDATLDIPELSSYATILQQAGFPASAASLGSEGSGAANQVGFIYDNLKYFIHSEWIEIKADYGIAPEIESYYISSGYNFSPLTAHITFATSRAEPNVPVDEIPIGIDPSLDQLAFGYQQIVSSFGLDNLNSWTLGLRWDVKSNIALKADWTRLLGRHNENSFFSNLEPTFNRRANLYQFGLEWVF